MKFPSFWRLLLVVTVLCWHVYANSVESPTIDRLKFDVLKERIGVPESLFLAMHQDQSGMIWILTKEDLIRFDGYGFKKYPTRLHDYRQPVDQFRQSLFIDRNDCIWVGRGAVISRFNRRTDRFDHYYLRNRDGVSGIPGITENKHGVLYALSSSGQLYQYDDTRDLFSPVLTPKENIDAYSFNIDSEDRFWVGGSAGLYRYFLNENFVEQVNLRKSERPLIDSHVYAIQPYKDDRLLIGTQDNGLIIFHPLTGEHERHEIPGWIYRVAVDSSDNIYLGGTSGIVILEADSQRVYPYPFADDDTDSMGAGTVWSILPDHEGNLWVGTLRSGLLVAYANLGFEDLHFKRDWTPLAPRKNNVSAISEDSSGRLWLGYHGDGVEMLDFEASESFFYGPDQSEMVTGSIYKVLEGSEGHLYVGCSRTGLIIIDPATQEVRTFSGNPQDPASPGGIDPRDMVFTSDGKLWLMFHENAVDIYDPATETFRHLLSSENPLDPENKLWFFDTMIDSENRVWLCSSLGLWVFSEDGTLLKNAMKEWIEGSPLSYARCTSIWEETSGCYWVGTTRGLFYLDTHHSRIMSYSTVDGLPSDQVCTINGVNDGTVWVATENGISHFDPSTREFMNYHKHDGLPTNGYYIGATYRSRDDELYFGGKHGVVRFRPENIRRFHRDAPVVISGFKLNNREVRVSEPGEPRAILTSSIETTRKIVLPYEPYSVSFDFIALSLRNSFENLFSFKLDGFDEEWSIPDNRRDCTYTNLDPGSYVFRVRAKNYEGNWLTTEANLELVILPPFWKSQWFRLVVGLILILVVGTLYYLRVHYINEKRHSLQQQVDEQTRQLRDAMHELEVQKIQIAEQNKRLTEQHHTLEQRIRERTEELEISKLKAEESDRIKSAFLENISHEFRTPMNAIIGGVTILCEEDLEQEERDYYASVVMQNSDSLLKLFEDILDLSRMEAGEMPIQLAPIDIDFFCEQLFSYYREYVRIQGNVGVDLVLDKHPRRKHDADLFFTDKKRLTQAFSHLIENAIKFTSKGRVCFGYRFVEEADNTRIQFFVEDTGIGIPHEQIQYIFDQFTKFYNRKESLHPGTGLGLSIVKKLTDSMGGRIRVDSVPREGTIMILEFPYSDETDSV